MELIVYAPVWGQSGYEKLSRGLLLALDQVGVTVELRPANEWNPERAGLTDDELSRLVRLTKTRVHPLAPHVIYQLPKGQPIYEGAPSICYSLFETDRVPAPWVEALSRMDHVFVFSEFNRRSWAATGLQEAKLSALPPAVDSFLYSPDGPTLNVANKKGFTFLCSGDFTERKNFEAVIEAFVTEFTDREPVTLIFKCHYGGFTKRYRRECMARIREGVMRFNPTNPPRVLFWGDKITDFAMASLYRAADCFVLASRGEGLGMQYLEAMACGKPVIACDWGAQTDYVDESCGYLVASRLQIIDDPNYIAKCLPALNSKWCQVDVKDLKATMRYAFESREETERRGRNALARARTFTWQNMAAAFIRDVIKMYDRKPAEAMVPA